MDIIIIGGFLGGGKTTTLNHLIKAAQSKKLKPAVIMNDFGKASVDSYLVDNEIPMNEMVDGCICCAMKADVSNQLHDIYLTYQPDIVFVECSGIAETHSVIDACLTPVLTPISKIKAVIGVVDASLYYRIDTYPPDMQKLYYDQLMYCSHLFVNKIDQCEVDTVASVLSDLNVLNQEAKVTVGSFGNIEADDLLNQSAIAFESTVPTKACKHQPSHEGIGHRYFEFNQAIALEDLVEWFKTLPKSTYRAKGFVQLKEHPSLQLVQYAEGQLEIDPIELNTPLNHYLVVIGSALNQVKAPIF